MASAERGPNLIYYTGWAKKVSYCTLFISLLNIDQYFHNFLPVDSVRNLLLNGMHTTLIMSLQYFVEYKYSKTYIIYKWTKSLMVNFLKYLT